MKNAELLHHDQNDRSGAALAEAAKPPLRDGAMPARPARTVRGWTEYSSELGTVPPSAHLTKSGDRAMSELHKHNLQ